MKLNQVVRLGMLGAMLAGTGSYSTPSFAQAIDPPSGSSMIYAGGLLGISFLDNNGGTQLVFGLNGGYKLSPSFGLGIYGTYQPAQAPVGFSANVYTLAAEGTYFIDRILPGLRASGRVGLGWISSGPNGGDGNTSTNLALSPAIGYDYALGGGLSVGGEVNYVFYSSDPSTNIFNFLGAIKYWF